MPLPSDRLSRSATCLRPGPAGMTLLEVIIASALFVTFVAAALSAGTAANNQDRLNQASMQLLEDTGRIQSFLINEFSRVPLFEGGYNSTSGKGDGSFPYPALPSSMPPAPTDPVSNDTTSYTISYIKLRSHLSIVDDPTRLSPFYTDIRDENVLHGVDGNPITLAEYANANPTPFMIYDPDQTSAAAWWIRPQWETFAANASNTLAQNSNPANLRVYFLTLRPSEGSWRPLQPDQGAATPPYVELGELVQAYSNGSGGPIRYFPLPLATGIDRRTFYVDLSARALTLRFRQHRVVSQGSHATIARAVEVVVRLPSLPSN